MRPIVVLEDFGALSIAILVGVLLTKAGVGEAWVDAVTLTIAFGLGERLGKHRGVKP